MEVLIWVSIAAIVLSVFAIIFSLWSLISVNDMALKYMSERIVSMADHTKLYKLEDKLDEHMMLEHGIKRSK